MHVNKITDLLFGMSNEQRSTAYKVVAITIGFLVFLVAIPAILFPVAYFAVEYLLDRQLVWLQIGFAIVSVLVGLFFLIWSVATQAKAGKDISNATEPHSELITTGPYALCRNPIQLGALFYCLGIGTYFHSFWVGLVMLFIALKLGSLYHTFLEEKELLKRFGDEYRQYKEKTPLVLPRFWR